MRQFSADIEKIQLLLNQGKSSTEIIKELHLSCTRTTFDRFIKREGLKRRLIDQSIVLESFDNGQYPKDIAKSLQIPTRSVYLILKKHGRDPAKYQYDKSRFSHLKNPRQLPLEDIKNKLENGQSASAIAQDIGYNKSAFHRFVRKNDLRVNQFFITEELKTKIIDYYKEGMKASEITRTLNVAAYTVSRTLRKAGYNPSERRQKRNPGQFVDTKPERAVKFVLDLLGVEYVHPYYINNYNVDFFIPGKNLLLDVDGEYWHGRFEENQHPQVVYVRSKDERKEAFLRTQNMEYLRVWELQTLSKMSLIHMLIRKLDLKIDNVEYNLEDVILKRIDKARAANFIEGIHYSGTLGKFKEIIGAFHNGVLIAAIVFGIGVYTKQFEITRFCIHPSYQKPNLASYVISRAIKMTDQKKIIAFADSTQDHSGAIYKASGFNLIATTSESYYYVDEHMDKYHKKTIYNQARKMKMSERDYVEKVGLVKVKEGLKYKYLYEAN